MDNTTHSISIVETEEINNKIQIILRQTDYTEEIAKNKLTEHNYNEISVIKEYFGINKKTQTQSQIKSVNQEIYKQIRSHLDTAMSDYRNRVATGEAKKIV